MLKINNTFRIYIMSDQSKYNCNFCSMLYTKSFISLHGYVYSPAFIELIYRHAEANR